MAASIHPLWTALLLLICFTGFSFAFGAGNIPDYAFLDGKAFRHGDIEDLLAELLIRAAEVSRGAIGFAAKPAGKKFSRLNVKRTYFGNWLRDYSQALDVGTLSKGLDSPTIRILVWILGFMSFGYATGEFEVTEERLGVYRPEEHIDNPKDYADNIDARQYDPRLRGPVDPRELQIDLRTGMKNYIANESGTWMTSTRYIRDSLLKAISLGRAAATDAERYEALRLLGQSLHTLEDLTAHSNWIELALIELGFTQVFAHVGQNTQVQIQGTNKIVWPMVTGTFGGTDFIHSLLGEATDHISETSLTNLNAAITEAQTQDAQSLFNKLKMLIKLVPGGTSDVDTMQQNSQNLASQGDSFYLQGTSGVGVAITAGQIANAIYPILSLRDRIMKSVSTCIDKIPGLKDAVDEIRDTMTVLVLSVIQPFIRPILRIVSENVAKSSAIVLEDPRQYVVWTDPNSTDPTHSMLSKDHFSCYLNEPAGNVAKVVISYAVTQVVAAWSNEAIDPLGAVNSVLACFCHPALLDPSSQLHSTMMATVKLWVDNIPPEKKQRIFQGLTREGVRQGLHHDNEMTVQVETQMSYSQQTVVTQGQANREIQNTMSSVVQTSIMAQRPTLYQSPAFAATQQLFAVQSPQQSVPFNPYQMSSPQLTDSFASAQQFFTAQSPQQSVSFKHDQMRNPQLTGFRFMQTRQPQTPEPTVVTRSLAPDPVVSPSPALPVPTTVFFRNDQMSNPGLGSMFIRPAPPLPAPQPTVISRDIIPTANSPPPVIQVQSPPPQIPQSVHFRHDQMSNPGHQILSAQTGALAPITNAVSTVGYSANRSTTYATDYRSTTVTANFSSRRQGPIMRPHDPYDYSLIYEMAKQYAKSNFSIQGSYFSQTQQTSYEGGDDDDDNAGEGSTGGVRPITRMWPYNTSQYKNVGSGENYVGATPQQLYNEYNQGGQDNQDNTGNQYNRDNRGNPYNQYNPSSYTGGPYTDSQFGQGQGYGSSETQRLQDNFQNLSAKESSGANQSFYNA